MGDEHLKLFEKLVTENERLVVQYIIRAVGCDHDTAKDIAQDVFVTAWIHIEKLYEHPNPVGWVFTTASYIARREMDRAYRYAEKADENIDVAGELSIELPLDLSLPKGLKRSECAIILMRLERGLPFEVIAEQTGMKDAACRKKYSRAIEHCRKLMEQEIKREQRQETKIF